MDRILFDRSKPRDLVAIGRSGVDLYPEQFAPMEKVVSFTKHVGGSPTNTAVQAAKMGLDTAFIGNISGDKFGSYVKYYLEQEGIDTSGMTVEQEQNIRQSLAVAEQREKGKIEYFFYRQDPADLHLKMDAVKESFISQFKVLLVSGSSLCASPAREAVLLAVEYAKRNNVTVVFDPDYRREGWYSEEETSLYYHMAAGLADIIVSTREEFDILEKIVNPGNKDDRISAETYLGRGVRMVCMKRGEDGAAAYTQDGDVYQGAVMPAHVYKTLGAGDSFCGTLIAKLIEGGTIPEALKFAAAAASITISGKSCSDSMPDKARLQSYMEAYNEGRIEQWDGWNQE
ncbi:5-dehydro-2-deoxygluconokinase [uncultured Clostridium sp.]|uniref:5-dehydro-2-deoxygluconokinase n=1 Tax=uncultured Clostridium sp. TaxID=59620 RepID=UPI0025CFB884|nr:5-dehydro-2-deoxygluconokinase [uncultured Clostridium sp.]